MYMFIAMNIVIMFYAIKVGVGVGLFAFMYRLTRTFAFGDEAYEYVEC